MTMRMMMNREEIAKRLPMGHSAYLSLSSLVDQLEMPKILLGDVESFPLTIGMYVVYLDDVEYSLAMQESCCGEGPIVRYIGREAGYHKNLQPDHITFRKIIFVNERRS
jgi:hypothetical protein